jgi:hypothetical protein
MWFRSNRKPIEETKPMPTTQDQIFPAHPGYSVLRFVYLDRKVTVEFARSNLQVLPVIGWRLVSGMVLPVGLGDLAPDDCVDAVLAPNGMIYDTAGRSWKGLDAYVVGLAAAWRAWRAEHHPASLPTPLSPFEQALEGAIIG